MFKQTKTTLKELSAQYRSVLKKCAYLNAIAIAGMTFGANADYIGGKYINEDTVFDNKIVDNQEFTIANNAIARSGIEKPNNEFGGYAFVNRPSLLTVENSSFSNISFDGYGAVLSTRIPSGEDVAKIIIKDSTFSSNHATEDGGAVANYGHLTISGSKFEKNTSFLKGENYDQQVIVGVDVPDDGVMGGGAIALGSQSVTLATSISSSQFNENKSGLNGGAIATRLGKDGNNSAATLDIEAIFTENKAAQNGGAIYNTFYADNGLDKGDGVTIKGEFTRNTAGQNGGAIFNDGALDNFGKGNPGGVMTINDSTFTGNTARNGGAIYNTGVATITGATFTSNTATGPSGNIMGGAIDNRGTLNITGKTVFNDNTVDAPGTEDNPQKQQNQSYGGAIYSEGAVTVADESEFNRNQAGHGGAIHQNGGSLTIGNDVKFTGNVGTYGAGGAILTKSNTTSIGDNVLFKDNVSNWGGAAVALQNGANVTIGQNAQFLSNSINKKAGNDAIVDLDDGNVAMTLSIGSGAQFKNNDGVSIGVRNADSIVTLADAVFMDNIGYGDAGAIYNIGTTNLNGTIVFQNNKVGNVLNDIYNDGTLNISGDLTLDGGITGDGTIEFTDDTNLVARLQKDSATINGQTVSGLDNVTIAGLVVENGLADAEYALVDATDDNIENQFHEIKVNNALYNFNLDDAANGSILVTRKSVAEQTANLEKAGLDSSAAKTIAAISAVKTTGNAAADTLFADLTAAAQSGDTAAAETINEVAKVINPESEAVVQSAAVSTQNTINTLTAGRMDLGRNGGDLSLTSGGVWVQGLFNRAKSGDKFSANTRGISAGIDGTINNDIMLGIGYAYGHSDVSAKTRDTDIDNHSVFLYGQYKPTQWYANATLNYTTSGYKENGSVAGLLAVNSEYRANAFGANVATGYDLPFGLTPELGLRYLHVRTNDYTNSLGFHTDAKNTNFLTGILGARYGFDITASEALLIRPELSAAAKYDLVSDGNTATVALPGVDAYTLDVERLKRFGGEFGAGLTMSYYGFDLSLNYYIDVREDYTSQTGMAKFRYNF